MHSYRPGETYLASDEERFADFANVVASRHRCATRISSGLVMSWLTMFPRLGTVMIHHAI